MERRPSTPLRTCVGCRGRTNKSDLLRVVAAGAGSGPSGVRALVPDPRGWLPGRGAYVHPDPGCLDLAERRRAFPRALRLPGPLDVTALRRWVEAAAADGLGVSPGSGDEAGRPTEGDGS